VCVCVFMPYFRFKQQVQYDIFIWSAPGSLAREEWALDQLADVEENLFRSTCE